ncbi:MAG: flagellar biosynthesis protein FlhB [Proteobacteria bacterium]|nr:flagellar biosynthesis protein FlhB [Pseudomonadota bacterium]MDA1328904.1 flagellar biosynthesis protein FlhB [Pseudomonadota bacterium]
MAEQSTQERTEEPTARRLSKAREDGQVARSVELPAAAVMISAVTLIFLAGGWLLVKLAEGFKAGFVIDRTTLLSPDMLPAMVGAQLLHAFGTIAPILLLTAVVAIVASGLTGGYLFSVKALLPKGSKLNPLNGLKRMFGPKALIELVKALLKFGLVAGVLVVMVQVNLGDLVRLGNMPLEPAMGRAGELIVESALYVTLTLVVIAAIDVPWQKYDFLKRMRMTKQEVKDELKDIEGRPEVKAQIRRRQREMSNARMMQKVKDADVVITNPEHFAVALAYDPAGDGAPLLVAKGADLIAQQIRQEANQHGVPIFEAPPLARALFFTTEVERPIPEALYLAVAQVIAYVFSLASVRPGRPSMAKPMPQVPPEMRFDANGQRG